jgi:hypothetical protein
LAPFERGAAGPLLIWVTRTALHRRKMLPTVRDKIARGEV